jgi:pimeloyl-ACP methyl ester carboxylesterase
MSDLSLQQPILGALRTRRLRSRYLTLHRVLTFPPRMLAAAAIMLGLAAATGFAVWSASGELAAPSRRPLQEYHRELLRDPAAHRLTVRSFPCLRGTSACLLVEPDASNGPTARAKRLRAQLRARDLALPVYGNAQGSLVLLHGRKGRKEDLLPVAARFAAAGFRSVIPDLPAHGDSAVSTLKFAADPLESELPARALQETRRKFSLPDEPAGLWGISMGGAYALRAAAASPQLWRSVVVVSGFDTLDGVVQDRLAGWVGSFAPGATGTLERVVAARGGGQISQVRPLAWAASVQAPALVVHGERDEVVAIARAQRLFDAFEGNKRFIPVPGAGHANVLRTDMPLYATMAEWFVRTMGKP